MNEVNQRQFQSLTRSFQPECNEQEQEDQLMRSDERNEHEKERSAEAVQLLARLKEPANERLVNTIKVHSAQDE